MTVTQIQIPAHARVGQHFAAEHPDIAGAWVIARVPPPRLETLHGVIFWGRDGYVQDSEEAVQVHAATAEVTARLMNR